MVYAEGSCRHSLAARPCFSAASSWERLHELGSSSAYTNFSHVRNLLNLIFSILSFPTKDVWPFERTNLCSPVASFERAVVRDTHVSVCSVQPRTGVQLSYSSMRLFGVDFRDVHQTESLLPESSAASTESIFEMNLHHLDEKRLCRPSRASESSALSVRWTYSEEKVRKFRNLKFRTYSSFFPPLVGVVLLLTDLEY